jgi:predicted MFS family arabinose efflux permease
MNTRGKAVLLVAHVAGMIDLVALPVWVGVLVQHYHFNFEQSGLLVTSFLLGAVAASLVLAPLFARLPRRLVAVAGYAAAAVSFLLAAGTASLSELLVLHVIGGVGTGCGLSMAHGAIGRSANPHRLFAIAGAALGVFAVAFYAVVPNLIAAHGGALLFKIIGVLMAIAACAVLAFPALPAAPTASAGKPCRISPATWFALAGTACLTLNQAIVFSFLERIGVGRGFDQGSVNLVLAAAGIVNLLPAVLAGLLQQRVAPLTVALAAPAAQAALAIIITSSTLFLPYAVAGAVYAFVVIFAHTFLFGLVARLDASGRATAAMPAVLMAGSAIGPILAGTVAQRFGFGAIGIVATIVAIAGIACFARSARSHRAGAPATDAATASPQP